MTCEFISLSVYSVYLTIIFAAMNVLKMIKQSEYAILFEWSCTKWLARDIVADGDDPEESDLEIVSSYV